MIREDLARIQHGIRAHWMHYLFSVCTNNLDGSRTIPADKVQRWIRQIYTRYADLSNAEQESDREQADKIITGLNDTLQKWEGYVLEVREDTFMARLVPLVGGGPDLEAEIYRTAITEEDQELVVGAVFHLSVELGGPSIRFLQLPPLAVNKTAAAEILRLFREE